MKINARLQRQYPGLVVREWLSFFNIPGGFTVEDEEDIMETFLLGSENSDGTSPPRELSAEGVVPEDD